MTAKSRPLITAAGRLAFGGCELGTYEPYQEPAELTARRARLEAAATNARREHGMTTHERDQLHYLLQQGWRHHEHPGRHYLTRGPLTTHEHATLAPALVEAGELAETATEAARVLARERAEGGEAEE